MLTQFFVKADYIGLQALFGVGFFDIGTAALDEPSSQRLVVQQAPEAGDDFGRWLFVPEEAERGPRRDQRGGPEQEVEADHEAVLQPQQALEVHCGGTLLVIAAAGFHDSFGTVGRCQYQKPSW